MKNTVKDERLKQKIAQNDLAQFCKVSRQTIHAIESQKLRPTVYLAIKIANFLNKSVEEIFYPED